MSLCPDAKLSIYVLTVNHATIEIKLAALGQPITVYTETIALFPPCAVL
jgi:hypothetical protein